MSPEKHIIRDLLASPSTADAIARRQRLPAEAVTIVLERMVDQGTVEIPHLIADLIAVYRIVHPEHHLP